MPQWMNRFLTAIGVGGNKADEVIVRHIKNNLVAAGSVRGDDAELREVGPVAAGVAG